MIKMCNCINEVKALCKAQVEKDSTEKGFSIEDIRWEYASIFPASRVYANIIIRSTFTKVNGEKSKPKNSHVCIHFAYCPFCGEKFSK